jgi:pimeloyl-ACP methyl ester carboxylesterase/class 3 adenylate cyclase
MTPPETRYAKSGDIHIAYQVFGGGPRDLVLVPGAVSNIELQWEFPEIAEFLTRLSAFCRVICFDKRGTGLSDRAAGIAPLEERMDDVRAVMDAAGSQRAVLLGTSEGGPMSILFAATHPERTQALVLYAAFAYSVYRAAGLSEEQIEARLALIEQSWGVASRIPTLAPSRQADETFSRAWTRLERLSASPSAFLSLSRMNRQIDVRHILPSIHVPALILHRVGDRVVPVELGRYIAKHLSGAKYIEVPGIDHLAFIGDGESVINEIEEFLTGSRSEAEIDRVLATVMFTDIVDSTKRAVELGDRQWRALLDRHDAAVRQQLARFRGQEIKNLGDGFLATFDGPARAVRCAASISESVRPLGISVRSGLHTGEIEMKRNDVAGIAVHIAARVAAEAEAGETIVSNTVRDLVAGSGLRFEDRGIHTLKGLPEEVHLYRALG